jgi:hypothetical protein
MRVEIAMMRTRRRSHPVRRRVKALLHPGAGRNSHRSRRRSRAATSR